MSMLWGFLSVFLASVAQLSLGYAMASLPPVMSPVAFYSALLGFGSATLALSGGLVGYLLSMFCWYHALHRLALSKAYALLSLSYVLVWVASMVLPGWHGVFSWQAMLGVACIMTGLATIFLPARRDKTR